MLHRKFTAHIKTWYKQQTPPVRRAVVFGGAISLWMLTGIFSCTPSVEQKEPGLFKVVVQPSVAKTIEQTLTLRGDIQPDQTANIKAETAGRVAELILPKGAVVKKGDVLLKLAPDSRPEKLAQAKADLAHYEKEFATAKGLEKQGFQAQNRVAAAMADLQAARAALADMELDLAHTQIKAPFDGIFEDRFVDVGDSVSVGADIVKVIDIEPLVLKGFVPQNAVAKVALARPVKAETLNGETLEGHIRYLASQADSQTRTYAVEVAVENPDLLRLAGSSVTMHVSLGMVPAHFISSAFLNLDAEGTLGVKVLEAGNKVAFYPANIVQSTDDGVWLSGLPTNVTLITVGNGFVGVGQEVDPQYPASLQKQAAAATSKVE